MRLKPVLISNSAGEWLLVLLKQEWMNAMRSTCSPIFGKISETHAPDCPRCSNLKGDRINGPTCSVKKPVFLSKPSSSWPSRLASSGL